MWFASHCRHTVWLLWSLPTKQSIHCCRPHAWTHLTYYANDCTDWDLSVCRRNPPKQLKPCHKHSHVGLVFKIIMKTVKKMEWKSWIAWKCFDVNASAFSVRMTIRINNSWNVLIMLPTVNKPHRESLSHNRYAALLMRLRLSSISETYSLVYTRVMEDKNLLYIGKLPRLVD